MLLNIRKIMEKAINTMTEKLFICEKKQKEGYKR